MASLNEKSALNADSPALYFVNDPAKRRYSDDDQNDQPGSKGGVEMQSFSPKPRSMMGDATTVTTQPTPAEPWTLFGWMRGNTNAGGAYRPVGPTGDLERRRAGLTRKVPTKVEPKVFFANERTYLAWLHMSMILATFSIGILSLSEKQGADRFAQAYGLVLMPVAIAFCVYALHMFMRRAAMLRRRDPGPWDERVAPTVLGVMLMVAIVTNFSLKIYDIYNPNGN